MSGQVTVVTGNEGKIRQATAILPTYGIKPSFSDIQVDELQSHEGAYIARHKALLAYARLQQPLLVNDHFWQFHGLNGWPGGYMKDMNRWLSAQDFLNLMRDKKDRSVTLTEIIAYTQDGKDVEFFSVEVHGKVIHEARGRGNVPCERVVTLIGQDQTIAENWDAGVASLKDEVSAWHAFAKWYKNK